MNKIFFKKRYELSKPLLLETKFWSYRWIMYVNNKSWKNYQIYQYCFNGKLKFKFQLTDNKGYFLNDYNYFELIKAKRKLIDLYFGSEK